MDYQKKYLKYKKKYCFLKNQTGGFILDLSEWTEITNSGQNNCGIFLSNKYPKYILKCETNNESNDSKLNDVTKINNIIQLFPKIINISKILDKSYTTMQKLDGDITSIFFNLFPKIVLAKMNITEEQKKNLFTIFEGKISYTAANSKSMFFYIDEFVFDFLRNPEILDIYIQMLSSNPDIINTTSDININGKMYNMYHQNIEVIQKQYDNIKRIFEKINNITDISFELYDDFITQLKTMWNNHYNIIIKEIVKIQLLLLEQKFDYMDQKFDNYGYILSNTPIMDDYRKFNAPKIFNRYLYLYFLDPQSGLYKVDDNDSIYQRIIGNINNGLQSYSVNGQYYITSINRSIFNYPNLHLIGIKNDMEKIFKQQYYFDDITSFQKSFTTIEDIKSVWLN
jgi:hypothetical protein